MKKKFCNTTSEPFSSDPAGCLNLQYKLYLISSFRAKTNAGGRGQDRGECPAGSRAPRQGLTLSLSLAECCFMAFSVDFEVGYSDYDVF